MQRAALTAGNYLSTGVGRSTPSFSSIIPQTDRSDHAIRVLIEFPNRFDLPLNVQDPRFSSSGSGEMLVPQFKHVKVRHGTPIIMASWSLTRVNPRV